MRGHAARVNNPSSRPDVKLKRSISSKERITRGERGWAGWNKGLSKETDERVFKKALKQSQTIRSDPKKLEARAENCRRQWKEGLIRAPKGPEHGNWKGGVSSVVQRARAGLYSHWVLPIMKRDGFCCCTCSAKGDLVVHHNTIRFADIVQTVRMGRDVRDMSFDEQGEVCREIVQYHLDHNVTGITLCRPCHAVVHELDPDLD